MTKLPDSDLPPRALFMTALPVEYNALREHLVELEECVTPHGLVGEVGRFAVSTRRWRVGLFQIGMGNERSAVETERAVEHLDPEVVFFVGIAGGIKDVLLGDVLVASKVYSYEHGKDAASFRPRPEALEPSYRIFQRAAAVARTTIWRARIRIPSGMTFSIEPRVVVKPLAAGSKVVGDTGSVTANLLRESFSDAAAVEMEGHGFLRALQAHPERQALIIRGISDLIDKKESTDAEGWQTIASATAAAFAFEVLARLQPSFLQIEGSPASDREQFWRDLHNLLVELYPAGPGQDRIWERAGGDLARIPTAITPLAAWFDAVKLIQRGGGGIYVSAGALLNKIREDYPSNLKVVRILEEVGS